MKRGTFVALEMSFLMKYVASFNSLPRTSYSMMKFVWMNFDKNRKFQNFLFSEIYLERAILRIPGELHNDFDINGEPKTNAKNPP